MFDVGIIGAGPAGYTLAIRLAQNGKKVVLFEKKFVGGTCLNFGCIPTKAILHSCSIFDKIKTCQKFGISAENITFDFQKIYERKNTVVEKMRKSLEKLIKSYGIEIIYKEASIKSDKEIICNEEIYNCQNIVVATGSKPSEIKSLPKSDFILNSDDILNLNELPKNIVIIGSGAIGIEWTRIFSSLGVEVHLVEMAENLLPIADFEVSQRIERILKRNKVKIYTSNCVEKIDGHNITLKNGEKITAEKILCATGRTPVLPDNKNSISTTEKGLAKIDKNYKNENGIYVIGDASSKIQLAHNAIHQALYLADYLCNNNSPKDYVIPSIIYGEPEIAWVGKTEQELEGKIYKKSIYPISALGKAQADGEIEGFIKLLSVDDVIVGAHIISPEASSLICEFILPVQNGLNIRELKEICHAHPTYSEGSFEAILGLCGEPLTVMKGV